MIKIIHSADMHIKKDNISISALKDLITEANSRDTDVLLISGDLFDTPFPDEATALETISLLGDCYAEIFISPGNHDPFIEGSVYDVYKFPENVHIFTSPDVKCVRARCGADIYGYAFTSYAEARHPLPEVSDKNRISIYSIHADLGVGTSNYSPIFATDIEMTKADYVALGHIHKRTELMSAGNTKYSYCGSLCSRDFGECGIKGALYGEFEKDGGICTSRFEFIPVAKHRFEEMPFTLTDIDSEEELLSELIQALSRQGYDKNTSLRLVLRGELSRDIRLSNALFKPVSDRLEHLEIQNNTVDKISFTDLENDKTVKGEVYRVLKDRLESENEKERALALLALKLALGVLKNEDPEMILEKEVEN